MNMDLTVKEVTDVHQFKQSAKKILEVIKNDDVPINYCSDTIFNMRHWLLGQILNDELEKAEFEKHAKILECLDKLLENAFVKERLKKYGVG